MVATRAHSMAGPPRHHSRPYALELYVIGGHVALADPPNLILIAARTPIVQWNGVASPSSWGVCDSRRVERTADTTCAVTQDMGVDHRRGGGVPVAQELLHGPDVVSTLEQMGGKGMAEGVTRHSLADPRCLRRIGHCSVHDRLVQMVPSLFSLPVLPSPRRWKDPLLPPVACGRGDLSRDRIRQPRFTLSACRILFVQQAGVHDVLGEVRFSVAKRFTTSSYVRFFDTKRSHDLFTCLFL